MKRFFSYLFLAILPVVPIALAGMIGYPSVPRTNQVQAISLNPAYAAIRSRHGPVHRGLL